MILYTGRHGIKNAFNGKTVELEIDSWDSLTFLVCLKSKSEIRPQAEVV
jgi:hypothetical protein